MISSTSKVAPLWCIEHVRVGDLEAALTKCGEPRARGAGRLWARHCRGRSGRRHVVTPHLTATFRRYGASCFWSGGAFAGRRQPAASRSADLELAVTGRRSLYRRHVGRADDRRCRNALSKDERVGGRYPGHRLPRLFADPCSSCRCPARALRNVSMGLRPRNIFNYAASGRLMYAIDVNFGGSGIPRTNRSGCALQAARSTRARSCLR